MELVELPFLPYAGTSGWSGSETSKERATEADASGETARRQTRTMAIIEAAGPNGITWTELGQQTGWHHGTASGALSVLHKADQIKRLIERRGRCQIYVTPQNVNGREVAPYKPNTANEQIEELRKELAEAYRKLEAANDRAERQRETIRKMRGD